MRVKCIYTSVRSQNELIGICQEVLQEQRVQDVNKAQGFAILADEAADIQICACYKAQEYAAS